MCRYPRLYGSNTRTSWNSHFHSGIVMVAKREVWGILPKHLLQQLKPCGARKGNASEGATGSVGRFPFAPSEGGDGHTLDRVGEHDLLVDLIVRDGLVIEFSGGAEGTFP